MKKEMIADQGADKLNIKEFLEQYGNLSSRKIKQLLKEKKIQINGRSAYFDNIVRAGDKVEADLSETGKDSTEPENIPIEIAYEDEYFLAVNKPAGMLVHPTQNYPRGTLANGVKHYFKSKNLEIPVRLVNRIDMDTSGLVVIAKSGTAHAALAKQLNEESSRKFYIAVAEGQGMPETGMIDEPIGIDDENPIKRTIRADGQKSITEFMVLEQFADAALLRLKLITGRTHQIRVHLSSMGHPLAGDLLYGGKQQFIPRQALHAAELQFIHPFTKEEIIIRAKMPNDMEKLIQTMRENSK